MSSTRISSILRSISAPTTNAYARISVYIAASYDAARNVRIPRKRKQKGRKKDSSTQNREREEEKRNGGEMDLSRVHNSRAEGASYSCLARGTFYACSLKHERVSLCNKRARAARTICVMYAHNAIITSDERKKERKEREEKGTSGRSIRVRMSDACVQCTWRCTLLLFATFANIRYKSFERCIPQGV